MNVQCGQNESCFWHDEISLNKINAWSNGPPVPNHSDRLHAHTYSAVRWVTACRKTQIYDSVNFELYLNQDWLSNLGWEKLAVSISIKEFKIKFA